MRSYAVANGAVLAMLIGLMRAAGQITPDAVQKLYEDARQLINGPEMAQFSRTDFLAALRAMESASGRIVATPNTGHPGGPG